MDTPSLIKIEEGKTEFSTTISSGIENSRIITFFNDLETYFGFVFIGEVEFSNFSQSRDNLTFNIDIGDLLSIYTINFFDKKTKANLKYNFSFFIPLVEYNYDEKNIEIVNGNGDLNISPVTDYIEIEKPRPKITEEIVIPEEKKKI